MAVVRIFRYVRSGRRPASHGGRKVVPRVTQMTCPRKGSVAASRTPHRSLSEPFLPPVVIAPPDEAGSSEVFCWAWSPSSRATQGGPAATLPPLDTQAGSGSRVRLAPPTIPPPTAQLRGPCGQRVATKQWQAASWGCAPPPGGPVWAGRVRSRCCSAGEDSVGALGGAFSL